MNRLLPALFFIGGLLGSAELSLTDVPATDSRYFWTYDGYREPVIDRNLSGNAIALGGRTFEQGICGHTPFSMVFRLDGTADRLTAFAGLEDEDHPKDTVDLELSIFIVVVADCREVFRQEVFWKAPPIRLEINLAGIRQLELRAESGRGKSTHRHRVALGNPVFHTSRPESLRRQLAFARKEREAALLRQLPPPPLPEWKRIGIALLDDGSFRVSNRDCEAVFAPGSGGRLIRFARIGGENLLAAPLPHDSRRRLKRGWATDFGGGHFLRYLPRDYFLPDDPMLEHAFYETTFPAEGVVVLRSSPSFVSLTALEYRFEFPPAGTELKLTGSVINCAPFSRNLGVWSLTRINARSAKTVVLPNGPRTLTEREAFEISFPASASASVLGAAFPRGERLEIQYGEGERVRLQVFYGRGLLELEGMGVVRTVLPGERVSLREAWKIEAGDAAKIAI